MGIQRPHKSEIIAYREKVEIISRKIDDIKCLKDEARYRVYQNYEKLQKPLIEEKLNHISVGLLPDVVSGIRFMPLIDAGYSSIGKIKHLNKSQLLRIYGIGERTANAILDARHKIIKKVKEETIIDLSIYESNKSANSIVEDISWILYENELEETANLINSNYKDGIQGLIEDVENNCSFGKWLLLSKEKKSILDSNVKELHHQINEFKDKVNEIVENINQRKQYWTENAWFSFYENKTAYLTILAEIVGNKRILNSIVNSKVNKPFALKFQTSNNVQQINSSVTFTGILKKNDVEEADESAYNAQLEDYASVEYSKNCSDLDDTFAVIDIETTWTDDVMSIGLVIANPITMKPMLGKYYILTPEYKQGGMYSNVVKIAELKETNVMSRKNAIEEIKELFDKNKVSRVLAYNASFDKKHLPELDNYHWCDIMRLAAYRQYNTRIPKDADCYGTGKLKKGYGVESITRMLTENKKYVEVHNAYCDVIDELKIVELLGRKIEEYDIGTI